MGVLRGLIVGKIAWFPLFLLFILVAIAAPSIVNPILHWYEAQVSGSYCRNNSTLPIVVLGGGIDGRAKNAAQIYYLKSSTTVRVFAGVEMMKQSDMSMMYLSGGVFKSVAESSVMGNLAMALGIPESRITLDSRSNSTYENSLEISRLLLENKEGRNVRLVTSAVHMFRAKQVFERQGIVVCPVPVHFQALESVSPFAIFPQTSVLKKSASLLHELAGLVYYYVSGKL